MPPPAPPPPPPAPPPGLGPRDGPVKIVPLLGDALHEMKKKLTGFEETPAASEGVSISNGIPKQSSVRREKPKKKTYGSQVPGKPNRDNAFLSEIQNKLSKRRDKVDAESYVVETPDHLVMVETLPPSGRGGDGDYSPGSSHRRMSKDSGRCSLTPSVDGDTRRVSVDYSHYRRVSVDMDRKEELALAKAVRKSSVKIRRSSPSMWDSGDTTPRNESSPETVPALANLPPPSPVVMRYWKQCAGAEDDEDEGQNEEDQGAEPSWKDEALKGKVQEFPSIRDKISNMEQVGKTIGQFTVSDVKSRVKTDSTPAAGWMEARSKLQTQLDSLIAKTSAKISKYGTVHAVEPREVVREKTPEEEEEVVRVDMEEKKKMISPAISNLIKSVASEIQKSFSSKNLASSENGDNEESCDENNNNTDEYWRNQNEMKHKQPKIDMEAPIDFDYNEPEAEVEEVSIVEELEDSIKETEDSGKKTTEVPVVVAKKQKKREPEIKMSETLLACLEEDRKKEGKAEEEEEEKEEDVDEFTSEGPVSFDKMPGVLESSAARSKATLMRKTSTERRLPASVLAKKKMAAKQNSVMQQIQKELIDASFQVNMSNTAEDLENMSDEDKVDLIAKQISKMESGYIMKLLKQLETGILDISVPMLMPFLSLQVRLDLGTNIFRNLEPENKAKMVRENVIQDMLSDITDIALLQEVIDRTQEKINFLSTPTVVKMDNYYSLEDDSFDLPSPGPRCFTPPPPVDVPVLTSVLSHLDKLMKEGSKKADEAKEEQKKAESPKDEEKATSAEVKPSITKEKVDEKSDESDEGLPSSDCDSSSEDDKETEKVSVVEREKTPEKIVVKEKTPEKVTVIKEKTPEKIKKEKEDNAKPPAANEGIIKQKLRNILDNCKTNDQQRPVREFGRNFEFQGMAQRPIVPNDRRPVKAKRLDDMWMNTMAKKDKWSCNTLPPTTSKPKVPWTMNKNTQPKKEEEKGDKDVKEFNKCHKNIKEAETKAVETVKKTVASVEKKEPEKKVESKTVASNVKKEEDKREKSPVLNMTVKVSKPENTEDKEEQKIIKEDKKEEKPVQKPKQEEKKEVKPVNTEVKSRQPKIDMEAPIDFDEVKKPDPCVVDSLKPPRDEPKKTKVTPSEPEELSVKAPDVAEAPAVLGTPTVRRRGDTFTVTIPLARGPAPPPPCSRPPPPPMSPPVTAARIVEMEKEENKVVGKVEREEESYESGEESEYEWTEESESEEEGQTYEVNKEGWENIMSSAKGPTTFNADYSIRVTGK